MERNVCKILEQWKYRIEQAKVMPDDITDSVQVILTNSLVGAVPVLGIDGRKLPPSTELCCKIYDKADIREVASYHPEA